jgi:hypothetical protein
MESSLNNKVDADDDDWLGCARMFRKRQICLGTNDFMGCCLHKGFLLVLSVFVSLTFERKFEFLLPACPRAIHFYVPFVHKPKYLN